MWFCLIYLISVYAFSVSIKFSIPISSHLIIAENIFISVQLGTYIQRVRYHHSKEVL